jgi:carbon monoxide dehydrogenase subunit G
LVECFVLFFFLRDSITGCGDGSVGDGSIGGSVEGSVNASVDSSVDGGSVNRSVDGRVEGRVDGSVVMLLRTISP